MPTLFTNGYIAATFPGMTLQVKTWEDGAQQALSQVMESYNLLETVDIFGLLDNKGLYDKMAWNMLAMKARSEAKFWRENEFLNLLARKQHDYGPENILKFGQDGLNVRLWDKVARLENLRQRSETALVGYSGEPEGSVVWCNLNESVEDTLTDIIGYVVIKQMLASGTFTKPLAADLGEPKAWDYTATFLEDHANIR